MFMNNFTRCGGFVKFWQSVTNLSCCNIDSITNQARSMKALVVIMLMLFTVGSTFGQTSARSVILDRCLADAPEPQFTQEDLEVLYAAECDGEELTFTVSADTTGDDCEWQVIYTYTINCGDNDPITLKTIYRGADQSAPQLGGTIPSDQDNLNFCISSIPDGPSEAEIVAQFTDNCTVLKPINVTKIATLDPTSTDCDWTMTYTYFVADDCGLQYGEDIKVVYSGGDIEAPRLKKNRVIPAGDLNSELCFEEKPQGPTEEEIALLFQDNCSTITAANVTKTGFSKGNNCKWMAEYTYVVTDDCNNSYPPFTIKYVGRDLTPPVLAGVPVDITVDCIDEIPPLPKKNNGPTATDNCDQLVDIVVTVNTENLGIACEGGTVVRTWTATDDCGLTDVQSQTITVLPAPPAEFFELAPEVDLSCEDLANYAPANLGYSNGVEGGACAIYGEAEPEYTAITENCGSFVVSYSFEDACGRSISASQTVNVIDNTAPVFDLGCQFDALEIRTSEGYDCPADAMISLNVGDEIDVNTGWTVGGYDILPLAGCVSDNCAADSELTIRVTDKTATQDSCNNELTITFVAEDNCGNISGTFTCSYVVIDDTAPTFTAPEDFTVYTDENCEYIATPNVTGEVTDELDNCNNPLEAKPVDKILEGDCEGELIIERTWTLKDACENFAPNQVQYIYVKDNTAPTFVRPADITIYTKEDCSYDASTEVTGVPTDVADNCSTDLEPGYTDVTEPGACPGEYVITRTWTLTDNCNNSAAPQAQRITVLDNIDPELTVPADETVQCDAVPPIGTATATDNCDPNVTVTFVSENLVDDDGDGCDDTYKIFRIWIAEDCSGNTDQKTQVITVIDTTPPVLTVPENVTVQCDAVPPLDEGAATATDNCDDNVEVTFIDEKFEAGSCTDNYYIFRSWKAEDCAGNSVTGTQTIIVVDTVNPVLTIPADVTVQCDSVPEVGPVSATDNCDLQVEISEVLEEIIPGSCPQTYTIKRTWTATDNCENTDTKTQTIEVQDTHAPVIAPAAMDMVVDCDGNGNTADLAAWLASNGGAEATDNCGAVTWSHNYCEHNGNGNGNGDDCDGVSLSDLCGETGSATVTFTATDECGNASSTSATFTIRDITAPTIDAPAENETVECDGAGNLDQFNAWLASNGGASASDECSDVVWSNNYNYCNPNARTVDAAGPWASFMTVSETDLNGNPGEGVFSSGWGVADAVVLLDANANTVTLKPNRIGDPAPFWQTGNLLGNKYMDVSTFIGDNSLIGQSFSFNGNVSSYTLDSEYEAFVFIRIFNADFSALLEEISVPLSAGEFSIAYNNTQVDAGQIQYGFRVRGRNANVDPSFDAAYDALGSIVIEAAEADCITFSDLCGATGDVTVTFTATDDCGNASSTTATFTIEDTTDPIFSVPADVTIECDQDPLDLTLTGDVTDESDACSAPSLEATFTDEVIPGDCPNESSIKRIWTLVDDCDNSYTLIQTITIVDTTPPTIDMEAEHKTVECDGEGNTDALNAWLANNGGAAATDNCGPVTWSNNYSAEPCPDHQGNGEPSTICAEFVPPNDIADNGVVFTTNFNDLYSGGRGIVFEVTEDTEVSSVGVWFNVLDTEVSFELAQVTQLEGQVTAGQTVLASGSQTVSTNGLEWVDFNFTPITLTTGNFYHIEFTHNALALENFFYNNENETWSQGIFTMLEGTQDGNGSNFVVPGIRLVCSDQGPADCASLSDDCGATGSVDVTFTATDECGNTSSTTATFTIEDTIAPTITVPADVTVECDMVPTVCDQDGGNGNGPEPTAWINEFHYDNDGGDQGEFVEVAANFDASAYKLYLYNGSSSSGSSYFDTVLGTGTEAGGVYYYVIPRVGIQNGAPDGIALADASDVLVQFLSYEGAFTGVGGPADGVMSTDIGLSEGSSTAIGESLQLTGTGSAYADFTWSGPTAETPGAANAGQTIVVPPGVDPGNGNEGDIACIVSADDCSDVTIVYNGEVRTDGDCPNNYTLTRTWTAIDACGLSTSASQVITVQDIVAPTFTAPANTEIFTDVHCAYDASPEATGDVEDEADNCSADLQATYNDVITDGPCTGSKVITRTWSLVDECNNAAADQVQIITVTDNIAPTFTRPADLTIDCTDNSEDLLLTGDVSDEMDNCSMNLEATYSDTITPGDCAGNYIINRTWSLVDDCDNAAANQVQTITVQDIEAPTLAPGAVLPMGQSNMDICAENALEHTSSIVEGFDIASLYVDNCSTVVVDITAKELPGSEDSCYWSIMYTIIVSDDCGNEVDAPVKLFFNGRDQTAPNLRDGAVLPVGEDGLQCLAGVPDAPKVADITALFEDNCDGDVIVTPLETVTTGDDCEGWSVTYGFSISDSCGNFADNVTVTYTGEDTMPPMLVGTPPDSYINGLEGCRDTDPGQELITDEVIRALFEDNCTANEDLIISIVRKPAGTDASWIVTYDVFISDLCNNKAAMLKFNYAGNDTTPPVISCPEDVDLTCVLDDDTVPTVTVTGENGPNDPFVDIPDNDPTGLTVTANLAGVPTGATITDITASIDVNHTWVGDLIIELTSPSGETLTLLDKPGTIDGFGDSSDASVDGTLTFTDSATELAEDMGADLIGGTVCVDDGICDFQPHSDSFANFIASLTGETNGDWTMRIEDTGSGDTGRVRGFSVNVTYQEEVVDVPRTDPSLTGMPTAEDCGEVTFTYVDTLDPDGVTITRTWTATDGAGLTDTCDQIIINDTDTTGPDMTCPADITAECGTGTPEFMLTAENTTGGDIPDNSEAGIEYPLTVAGVPLGATVTDLSVDLAIEHTWVGDLIIELRGPNGEVLNLVARPGAPPGTLGDSSNAAATAEGTISFDDNAASGVNAEDMGATILGSEVICLDDGICNYFPNDQSTFFSDIIGGDPNGEWNLFVSDNGGGDTGFVANWALNVTYTTPLAGGAVVEFDAPTATDNCDDNPTVVQTGGPESGSLFPVGDTLITYEATDAAGNVTPCSFTVSVVDTTDPMLTACPDDIEVYSEGATAVESTATGTYGPQDPIDDIPDNDPVDGLTVTANVAGVPASATVTDITASIDASHTWVGDLIIELTAPSGESITLLERPGTGTFGDSSNASVDGTLTFTDAAVTFADDMGAVLGSSGVVCLDDGICDYLPHSDSFANFIASLTGETNGDWTMKITDSGSGDTGGVRGFSVNVTYITEPVDGAVVDYVAPTASDSCDGDITVELTSGLASGEFFPLGDTVVTYTATDAAGNSTDCSFTVTVNENTDTVAPEITCPDDIVVDAQLGTPAMTGTATGSGTGGFITDGPPRNDEAVVSGIPADATITDITVDLVGVTHSWAGDLEITLVSPTGVETLLLIGDQGGFGDEFTDNNLSFDDTGASLDNIVFEADGTYQPQGDTFANYIASLAGDQNGTWVLNVVDNVDGDDGEYDSFNINISWSTPEIPDGVVVNYDLPTATDDVDGPVAVDYVSGPMSGDYLEPGVYTVEYSATDAAGNSTDCSFTVTVNDVLISRAAVADEKMDFRAYPVPFENEVTIQYMFEYDTNVTIEMFDTKGLLVATKTNKNYMSGSTERVKFDLSRTAVQMLYVKLTTNQGSVTKKIVSGK